MRLIYNILFAVTLVGGSIAAWLIPSTTTASPVVDATPASIRQTAIAFYEHRLTEDPHSALDMAQLAALVMEEGRMSGDERSFVKAESLAIRSLGERTRKNGRSAALLVNALLAQHRFAEANVVVHDLVEREPDEPGYRALLAESLMEVGDYAGAIRELGGIRARRTDLGIAPRFAR
jgi:DNA-binding SARP family transcriptional activator